MPILLVLFLTAATFISMKGSRVVMTLFAVDLGATPLEIGVLFALYGLAPFLLVIYAGRIADRFDNRVMMYWGLGGFVASLCLPFAFPGLPALYAFAPLSGFSTMLFVVATQNFVGALSTAQTRTRNFSYYSLGESVGSVLGPVLVGIAIDAILHPLTFLSIALYTALLGMVLVARRGTLPHNARKEEKPAPRRMQDLLRLPAMRNALLTNAVVMTGLDLFNLYMPVYTHGLGFSATTTGLILGAFGVAAFVIRLAIPPFTARWGEHAMLVLALALSAAAFVIFPLTSDPLLLATAAFVLGLGLGCGQPLSMVLAYNAAPPGRSAEGISMRLAVSYGSHVVIPPVFGAIGAGLGLAPVFWTCSLLLAGGSLLNRRK